MFTGIIQGLGDIIFLNRKSDECFLKIRPLFEMDSIQDGESIAVNGICLSVEKHDNESFSAYASKETFLHTTLQYLKLGDRLNLERALSLKERFGGHFVSGHIDCIAEVLEVARAGHSLRLRIGFPKEFAKEVIRKGSIALDGISLTINNCGLDFLEVNIIPDSQKRTTITHWKSGTKVNMETDLLGKYVINAQKFACDAKESVISRDFLFKHGFIS